MNTRPNPDGSPDWSPSPRYPDPAVRVLDERFAALRLPLAKIERLATGCRWAEGPVWVGDARCLLWSDIPNDRILRWDEETGAVSAWRKPAGFANGATRDRTGRIVHCEHGGRRVVRTEPDGRVTVLADRFDGRRLNSPNDVVCKSDGSIWFTDPPYGIMCDYEGHKAESEIGANYVYRLDPRSGELAVVADDFDKPNGIAFSPDESLLYVADTGLSHDPEGPHHIRRFKVGAKGRLSGGEVFAVISPGVADGFRLDTDGNVWTSAGDGVHCYAPDGTLLGRIKIPEAVANVCFGGPKRNRLFITATTSLYAVYVAVNGVQRP